MKIIKLNGGLETIVDDDDFEMASKIKWFATKSRDGHRTYVVSNKSKRLGHERLKLHRVIVNAPTGMDVDHINSNGLDNRKSNLRICTRSENLTRKRYFKNKTSKFRGVMFDKHRNKWRAAFRANKKHFNLGRFPTEAEAAMAYNNHVVKYLGHYAVINNLEEPC